MAFYRLFALSLSKGKRNEARDHHLRSELFESGFTDLGASCSTWRLPALPKRSHAQ